MSPTSRPSSSAPLAALFTLFFIFLGCIQVVHAHIEMQYPPGINSKFDPQTPEASKDYSMTSPLADDGSNYPCKGYNIAANYEKLSSVATLQAGSSLAVQLAGSAVHNGGSCQFSVSYDQGKTFAVIASIMGGCPIGLKFDVPIPKNLPAGKKATFSWSWFNFSGNREMYQNCAIVDIESSSSATSYTGPSLFRANTFADGTCIVPEGTEVVFPNPGPSTQFLGAVTSASPATVLDNCPFNEDGTVTVGPSGSSTSDNIDSAIPASNSSLSISAALPAPTIRTIPSIVVGLSTTNKASPSSVPVVAAAGALATDAETVTTSLLRSKAPSVRLTTSSRPASSFKATTTDTASSSSTYIQCDTLKTWSLCAGQDCTAMGDVAAGTACVNGGIVAESSLRRMRERRSEGEMRKHLQGMRMSKMMRRHA